MESRGRGCRGGGPGNNRMSPAFDQQVFMEAIGATTTTITHASVAATTIAQASAMVGQGGSSNLQRFKAHHPPTFMGGGNPILVLISQKDFGGYGDHLRCHIDKTSNILARG